MSAEVFETGPIRGVKLRRLPPNGLFGLHMDLATVTPPGHGEWRVAMHANGNCIYFFTDIPHPEGNPARGPREAIFAVPFAALIEAAAKEIIRSARNPRTPQRGCGR